MYARAALRCRSSGAEIVALLSPALLRPKAIKQFQVGGQHRGNGEKSAKVLNDFTEVWWSKGGSNP